MTPQEHSLLEDFLARLAAAGSVAKDAEADALIQARLAGHPDAGYLLVQRALLLERALVEANSQIALLRQAAPAGGSFLGSAATPPEGFGRAPSNAYVPDAVPSAGPGGWRNRWFGAAPIAPAPQPLPVAAAAPSLLGQVASTAAGVAGGMFLFSGIEHLLGGGNHGGGFGGTTGNSLLGSGSNDNTPLHDTMVRNIDEDMFTGDAGGGGPKGLLGDSGNWADDGGSGFGGGDYPDGGSSFI